LLQTLLVLVVNVLIPRGALLGLSLGDELKTGAEGIGGTLADDHLGVAQGHPDVLEELGNIGVKEGWRVLGHLAEDQHGRMSAGLMPVRRLKPLQGPLDLKLNKLSRQGSSSQGKPALRGKEKTKTS